MIYIYIYLLLFLKTQKQKCLIGGFVPDVYVKRFVICKLSIATCSSGGVNGSVSAVLRGSECPSSLLPTRNTQLNEKRDLAHTLSNLEPL